jgi:hypothetical protein
MSTSSRSPVPSSPPAWARRGDVGSARPQGRSGQQAEDPGHLPAFPTEAEHYTFNRVCMLSDAAASHAGAFTRDDLQALLDGVACAFFDQTTAPWLSRFVITVSTFDCVLTTILGRISSLARIAPAVAQDLRRHGRRPTVDKATRDRGPRLVTVGVNAGSTSVCQGARVHPRRFRSTIWLGQPSRGAASPGASTSNPRVGGSNPPRRVASVQLRPRESPATWRRDDIRGAPAVPAPYSDSPDERHSTRTSGTSL